jgi:hypothetical protein
MSHPFEGGHHSDALIKQPPRLFGISVGESAAERDQVEPNGQGVADLTGQRETFFCQRQGCIEVTVQDVADREGPE